jgi:glycosyltransferase involved in cell wall biosynthesis
VTSPGRVLIVADHCFPASGTLVYLSQILDIHRRHGIRSALLTETQAADPGFLTRLEQQGVPVYAERHRSALFRKSYLSILWDIAASRRAVRAFRPDLILVSSGNAYLHIGLFVHPVPVAYALHSPPLFRFRRGTRSFLRLAQRAKNRCVTMSRFAARRMQECMGIPVEKIDVIHNSYRELPPVTVAAQRRVLTVGEVIDYKNPAVWLDVAERVTRQDATVEFVWAGRGSLLDRMRAEVRARGLGPQVRLEGPSDHIEEHYARSALYFHPSRRENQPLAVLEAMSRGLPCVTSNAGGLPETVADGQTGFVCDPDDADSFCRHIRRLLDDPTLRTEMGRDGRDRADALFSPQLQEQKLLALYQTILTSPTGQAE